MEKPIIALSTHIFGNRPLLADDFKLLRDFGIKAIELWFMDPQIDIKNSTSDIARIKRLLDDNEIICASVHAPFWVDLNKPSFKWLSLSSLDLETRKICINLTKSAIYAAKELGAKVVVVHGIGDDNSRFPLNLSENIFTESLVSLSESINNSKVWLAIENIITPYSRPRLIREFIKRFEHELIGMCIDIGHAFIEDNPINALTWARGYLFEVHIADNFGYEDDHLLPYEGKIDWEPIWQGLKETHELKVATLEIMPPDISGEGKRKELEGRLEKIAAAIDELKSKLDG